MKITYRVTQRFLERVVSWAKYTQKDVEFAMKYLEILLTDVVICSTAKHFVLPGFEEYKVVCCMNVVATMIPKRDTYEH